MRYAFVSASILAIWAAVLIIAHSTDNLPVLTAQIVALFMTIVLFIIGFRRA